ncbi:MAG TPA: amino acid adenylation domain-containing protein, partial [Candidatus Kapabacteria bacterium]|nr:amino acid adenylation domain-containing protein [Candidatus Kapabacteria bacterium]
MINKEGKRTLENLRIAAHQHIDERNFWLQKLSGEWVKSHFPYDRNIKDVCFENSEGAEPVVCFEFQKILSQRLIAFSNGSDTRLFMILLTGLYLLLHRYSGEADLVVGLPLYKQDDEERLINKMLAVRNRLNDDMSVKQLLMEVRASLADAIEHYGYPIELLPELLNLPFSEEEFPLFDVAILLENIHNKDSIHDIRTKITYCFIHNEDGITAHIEYNRNYYSSTAVRRFISHFQQVLQSAFQDVESPIRCIDLVPEDEKQQLLFDFNNNKGILPVEKTIYYFVEQFAQDSPDRIALAGTVEFLTYKELNRRANGLAGYLKLNGINEDQLVGILLDRSALMLIAILAIWKAGGAYIPMNRNFPQQRIQEILKDSNAPVLLLESQYMEAEMLQDLESKVIVIESLSEEDRYTFEKNNQNLPFNMFSLSYVIYTSGSTGKPKGVMVEHIGMMNHIQAKINDLQITGESIIAQNASHTFDISVWQFFAVMVVGGKTVIYPEAYILEPHLFVNRLINDRISILEVVPSYLSILLNQLDTGHSIEIPLKYLLVTGEEVKSQLLKQWFSRFAHIPVINAYGPTEASDDITHFLIKEAPDVNQIPIGKPVLNFNIYILDKNMNLCPIGVKGEICVSGIGVGRGYLNDEEKTQGVFIKDPFIDDRNVRLYKTGDLGCWGSDGNIEFFGRIDYQVKIRGFRIEPGEIESKILNFEGIKKAIVIEREDGAGENYLCAYCIVDGWWNISQLREYLHSKLPPYMVPLHFVRLEKFPLSSNGKIDRKALPEPASDMGAVIYISADDLTRVKVSTVVRRKEIDAFLEYPESQVLLSAEEKEKILWTFNDTRATFPDDRVIQQFLEEQATRTPDRTALVFKDQHL